VARSLLLPVDQIKYSGEESEVACPVCHCNILHVPDHLPQVYCPLCWVRGELRCTGDKMSVKWNLEDARYPRFSIEAHLAHFKDGDEIREKLYAVNKEKYDNKSKLMEKYSTWGNIVKP
jgi:hypothetical protein